MNNFVVYMHINRINGKLYIGITCNNPKKRWKRGAGYTKQKRFYSAIKSYGWDNFDHIILLENLSKEDAENYEHYFIKMFKSNDLQKGYNIENGGVIHKLSEEQIEHLRKINTGRKASAETKKKMRESHLGMSTKWLTGRKASAETKAKMSLKTKGANNPNARAVLQYDLDGNFIAEYSYMNEIVKVLGVKGTCHISDCCRGIRKKAYGYKWSYAPRKVVSQWQ